MKLVISDPKTGKAYQKVLENPAEFLDKKIGQTVSLSGAGLADYSAEITGGADLQGFAMRKDFNASNRKRNFVTMNRKEGLRMKITQRGSIVGKDIAMLNLKVTKYGDKSLEELIGSVKKEEKKSAKEELIEHSLQTAGTADAAKAMADEEFKKGKKRN